MTLELDLGKPRRSTAEAERAVVGIYYLLSCSCMVNRKPVTTKYYAKDGECYWSLATGSETPPDSQLIQFVELQRLAEESALVFRGMNVRNFQASIAILAGFVPQDRVCLPSILIDCLEVIKSFPDSYLQLSPYAIEHHSMMEKSLFAQAILILMKVAFRTNPSPKPSPLRQACNVRYCLNA